MSQYREYLKERAARLAAKPMSVRVVDALQLTWQQIAYDMLTATGEDMSGAAVREVTVDYIDMYGDDKDAVTAFRAMSRTAQDRLLRAAFPHRHYCL